MAIETDKELIALFAQVFGYEPTRNRMLLMRKLMDDRRNLLASIEALHIQGHADGRPENALCDLVETLEHDVYLSHNERIRVVDLAREHVASLTPPIEQRITSWLADTKH